MTERGKGGASFPRSARVLKPAEFLALRRNSRRISVGHFHAEASATERDTARVGMAVSRRVSKRAVVRNRIKRQVRESFRHCLGTLPSFDVMVVARGSAASQDNAVLRADLERLWQRLSALGTSASGVPALKRSPSAGTIAG
ncbi:MAG: ribonuclease P protein component [Dokdonella sp.]